MIERVEEIDKVKQVLNERFLEIAQAILTDDVLFGLKIGVVVITIMIIIVGSYGEDK